MQALVLEKVNELRLRDVEIPELLGPRDVRIRRYTAPMLASLCGYDYLLNLAP